MNNKRNVESTVIRVAGNILAGRRWANEDLSDYDRRAGRLAVQLAWFLVEEVRRTAPPDESLFTETAQNAHRVHSRDLDE